MGAAAAGSMEFLATLAVRTATELKMVAHILTKPHMCSSEQAGLGQALALVCLAYLLSLAQEKSLSCVVSLLAVLKEHS